MEGLECYRGRIRVLPKRQTRPCGYKRREGQRHIHRQCSPLPLRQEQKERREGGREGACNTIRTCLWVWWCCGVVVLPRLWRRPSARWCCHGVWCCVSDGCTVNHQRRNNDDRCCRCHIGCHHHLRGGTRVLQRCYKGVTRVWPVPLRIHP
jgi:hypothetical protein